jgi:hypothetical protein
MSTLNKVSVAITLSLSCLMLVTLSKRAWADQSIGELESDAYHFDNDVQALYRLDHEDLNRIWEAYCGEMDPYANEDRQFAAEIGKQLQNGESGKLEQLLNSEAPRIKASAKNLMQGPDRSKAEEIYNKVEKEEANLERLLNGVVLKGSNHPFVQYAIEYGKEQHQKMCGEYGGDPKVCDQRFEGLEGRPDLVTVEYGHLKVYEFKPNNNKAKSKGETQLSDYVPKVVAYYQKFFEDGRNGGFKGEPDSEHGGVKFLKELKASKDAWSTDGSLLQAIPELKTYEMCEKRFDN